MIKHVLIVGGGIVGWCSAYRARQAGFEVTVLEREFADHQGASSGNSGLIVPSHVVPLAAPGMVQLGLKLMLNKRGPLGFRLGASPELWAWAWRFMRSCSASHVERCAPILADLHLRSKAEYLEFTKRLSGFEVEQLGLLGVCQSATTLEHEEQTAAMARQFGVHSTVVTGKELQAMEPSLAPGVAGAVWYQDDAHLNPGRLLELLRAQCIGDGVKSVTEEAARWTIEGTAVKGLVTQQGTHLDADEFVLAAGTWSRELGASLGLRLPVIGGKGHSMNVESPTVMPKRPMILTEARVAITPLGNQLRIAGTMELGPARTTVNLNRVEGIRNSTQRFLPHISMDQMVKAPIWAGLRPVTPDGMPLLGRPKRYTNLIVATGHAMMGLSLGPITGNLVTELLQKETPSISLTTMDPDRFG